MDIASIWQRIAAWYDAHTPEGTLTLVEGAGEDEINAFEEEFGFRLPDDLRTSFAVHNGSGDSFFLHLGELLSLKKVLEQWRMYKDWQVEEGWGTGEDYGFECTDPAVKPVWWNPGRLPLTDNSGDHIFADFDPGETGRTGQILEHGHEDGPSRILASTFEEWLTSITEKLEAGEFRYDDEEEVMLPPEE